MQVRHVLQLHPGVGGIGQCGVKVLPLPPDTAGQRIGQIQRGPAADTGFGILADVRGQEGAEIEAKRWPPDRTSSASPVAPSAMWQEAQPVAQNTRSPRAASPVSPAIASAGRGAGRVHQ
ncbi:hypothetical protein MASR1M32_27630 [Rhodobacter sp.]